MHLEKYAIHSRRHACARQQHCDRTPDSAGTTGDYGALAAQIDGRAMVAAHGSREMPVWGLRFGEKFGGEAIGEEAVR